MLLSHASGVEHHPSLSPPNHRMAMTPAAEAARVPHTWRRRVPKAKQPRRLPAQLSGAELPQAEKSCVCAGRVASVVSNSVTL